MWLLIAFIAIPLIEIALFIQVGGAIGLWPTLAIVVLTAMLGTFLVRQQGVQAMSNLRGSMRDLRDPTEPLAHGAMILFSAALLLTPGFFTDTVGFLLLVPAVRVAVMNYVRSRVKVATFEMGQDQAGSGHRPHARHPGQPRRNDTTIIDGEYAEVDPDATEASQGSSNGPSGWTRH